MMDLWATVPYYTAYLSRALTNPRLDQPIRLTVGSISYYLDPRCFSARGVRNRPGLVDIVGRLPLPRLPRRVLKLAESLLNLSALSLRFLVAPPDVVHVQFLPMLRSPLPLDLWFVQLCRARGARIILTVHDLLPHDTGDAHRQTYASLYRQVDAIVCHAPHIRTRLAAEFAVPESKVSVIPHGPFFYDIPPTQSSEALRGFAVPPDQPFVLWQGIVFPYKGIDVLLDAWQLVESHYAAASHPATTPPALVIAGTGSPELLDQLRAQIAALNLARVHLHLRFVSTQELVALYRAAAVVVYPYRAITTSGALATGLALGKTILATDLPVFRELLTDRENALLVPPQDPPALAAALIELTGSPALRDRLAQSVRAMNFGDQSWLDIARQTIATYHRVLTNASIP
jgi:glycosyltransferase involved in cell wall biosynthesis